MNSNQHYVQITYTELRRNRTMKVYSAETFIYIPMWSTAVTTPIFHETHPSLDKCFVDIYWNEFFFQVGRKVQIIWAQLRWSTACCEPIFMKLRIAFNGIAWRSPTLHRISSKTTTTNERYREQVIYSIKQTMTATEPNFTKLTLAWQLFVTKLLYRISRKSKTRFNHSY